MKNCTMPDDLRRHIGEIYDGSCWDNIVGNCFPTDGQPFFLWKFDADVEYDGAMWRCVIVEAVYLDANDLDAVDYAEDVFSAAWKLR